MLVINLLNALNFGIKMRYYRNALKNHKNQVDLLSTVPENQLQFSIALRKRAAIPSAKVYAQNMKYQHKIDSNFIKLSSNHHLQPLLAFHFYLFT
jgi:predicted 2-oxoglutarate/Fe(II)-dependent dioxygenase YbiX